MPPSDTNDLVNQFAVSFKDIAVLGEKVDKIEEEITTLREHKHKSNTEFQRINDSIESSKNERNIYLEMYRKEGDLINEKLNIMDKKLAQIIYLKYSVIGGFTVLGAIVSFLIKVTL